MLGYIKSASSKYRDVIFYTSLSRNAQQQRSDYEAIFLALYSNHSSSIYFDVPQNRVDLPLTS